jgi:predicted solute-binding protein
VRENVKNVFSLEIFPNPAKESARITINASRASETSILLFNSLGEMLSEKNVSVREGKNTYPLDVSALPEGIYFVSIKSANSTTARKLVVY